MHRIQKFRLAILMALCLFVASGGQTQSRTTTTELWAVRQFGDGRAEIGFPFALVYSPSIEMFFAAPVENPEGVTGDSVALVAFDFYGDAVHSIQAQLLPVDPINVAYDPRTGSLFYLEHDPAVLNVTSLELRDIRRDATAVQVNVEHLNLQEAKGMTVDADRGRLFILDGAARKIVVLETDRHAASMALAIKNARISYINLGGLETEGLRGIAFNPADGRLYTLDVDGRTLYQLDDLGRVVAKFELEEFGLENPQGFVFAPSGDLTDEPTRMSAYIADAGRDGTGKIIEIAFGESLSRSSVALITVAPLVQIIDASQFEPPSPDTAGVAFISDEDRLVMSDSEVNEMPIYQDANIFISSPQGVLQDVFNTLDFSKEPTGVAYKPDGKRLFISDDSADEVFELGAGPDGVFGTSDDEWTSFDTRAFNSLDPEGIAYEGVEDRLFIADGVNSEIYEVRPGPNGVFDGIDDVVTQFDTERLGVRDPEGITFNPDTGNLYVVGRPEEMVLEVTTMGEVVQFIDISEAEPRKSAGLGYGRRSSEPSLMSLYVAERGVDNDSNPNENDGKVYELGLDIAASSATPTSTPTSTPTPTVTSTPTPRNTPTATPIVPGSTPDPNPTEEVRDDFMLFITYFSAGSSYSGGTE